MNIEEEVIKLVRNNLTAQEIADKLELTYNTVISIKRKLPLELEKEVIKTNMEEPLRVIKEKLPYLGVSKIIDELTRLGKWKKHKQG